MARRAADFVFLQRTTGLTQGNLSRHLTKLEDAGLVRIEKSFVGKRPETSASLTPVGRERTAAHWEQLERMKGLGASSREPYFDAIQFRPRRRQSPA